MINFPRALLLLFIAVPVLELYLLIKLGGVIGALPTIMLVVLTAFVGVAMLRSQGVYTYARVQESMARGELPANAMLEGVALLFGGVLLLFPGLLTDGLGLVCLIPFTRRWMIHRLMARLLAVPPQAGAGSRSGPSGGPGRTLEGEFRREDD